MTTHFDDLVEKMLKEHDAEQAAGPVATDMPAEMIVRNSMVTPDGTELVSNSRHDYKEHRDANGQLYVIDGGRDYLRRSVNEGAPATDTSISYFAGHEVTRQAYVWGTYGPDGDQEKHYVALANMNEGHIQAIINDQYGAAPLMRLEQKWRKSAGARKLVRKQDIERLLILKAKYEHNEKVVAELDALLVPIVEQFNANEFNDEA